MAVGLVRSAVCGATFACIAAASAAQAELPAPVRAMIEAAIATNDAQKVSTVVELARQTNPDDVAQINALHQDFVSAQQRLTAQEQAAKEKRIRSAGLFANWSGKGEIGAARSTGNSSETGLTAALALTRTGIDWRHKLLAKADYQRSNGLTTREQFLLAYEPNYTIDDGVFAYALTQYERDRFQGYASRISLSSGLGYRLIDSKAMHLSIKAGPAWRRTDLIFDGTQSSLAGLAALDFDWQFATNLKLTEDASAYIQSANSSFNSTTGLQAKLNDNLAARISYTVEMDTNPPPGAVKTDTLSRFTVVYDF